MITLILFYATYVQIIVTVVSFFFVNLINISGFFVKLERKYTYNLNIKRNYYKRHCKL